MCRSAVAVLGRAQLGQLALGDVDRHTEQLPAAGCFPASARRDPAYAAVGHRYPVLEVELAAGRERLSHGVVQVFAIPRMGRGENLLEIDRSFARRAGVPACLGRARCLVARHVPHEHRKPRSVRREIHPLLAFLERGRHPMARAPLDEKGGNQPRLEQQDGDAYRNLLSISAPRGRLAVPHDGIGRQQALVDAPALKRTPVDHGHIGDRHRRDLRRRGAVQEAHDDRPGLLRLVVVRRHVASDDAGAQEGFERSVDRGGGRRRDTFDRLTRSSHLPRTIDEVAGREDNRVSRQLAKTAPQLRRRQARQVHDLDARSELPHGFAQTLLPNPIAVGRADHHHQPFGVGMKPERECERGGRIEIDRPADEVRRERHAFQLISRHRDMHDRHTGKHPIAEPGQELKRCGCRCDDCPNVARAVLLAQKRRIRAAELFGGEPLDVEVFRIHLDGATEPLGHDLAHRVLDHDGRRRRPLIAVNDQDCLRHCRAHCGRTKSEQGCERGSRNKKMDIRAHDRTGERTTVRLVADTHVHPGEKRSFRVSLSYAF